MPELPIQNQAEQKEPPQASPVPVSNSVPLEGKRLVFRGIPRQLSAEDMANPGTQKLILDLLLTTEQERDDLKLELAKYVPEFHECAKKVAVMEEKLKSNKVVEIMFGVSVGLGCAIFGLAPFFWDVKPHAGPIALAVGVLLTLGASIGRIVYK